MSRNGSTWIAEAAAIFAKDWRCELRTRHSLNTVALFAVTTLFVVGMALGPLGVASAERGTVLPVILWIVLLFAAAAGLPRTFVREEEARTAVALRLAATPSALFSGKLLYGLTLLLALQALVTPLFLVLTQLSPARPDLMVAALAVGGYGLAAGSTLVASIIAQARGKGALFAVLSFPILAPILLLSIEITRAAVLGQVSPALGQALLYDATLTVAGLMLFPVIWNP